MQLQRLVFTCAASGLLVFASASYAADAPAGATNATPETATNLAPAGAADSPAEVAANPPAEPAANPSSTTNPAAKSTSQQAMAGTAVASNPPVVTNPNQVYLIRENPFFDLHIDKAVKHAHEAEIAGNMGETALLLEHAKMSLMQAREAQRAGNVAGLNEGIANLKQALNLPVALTQTSQPSSAMGTADPRCIDELQRECGDVQPGSGRIQQCFDDKINNFSPMCQEKLKEGKAATAASITQTRHEQSVSGTQRTDAAVRSATAHVREARKNLSEAGGLKFKEIQPPVVTTVSTDK